MKHPRNIDGFACFDDLVDEITANDHIRRFLEELADDLCRQGDEDYSKGRKKLAGRLYDTGENLYYAARKMDSGRDSQKLPGLAQKVGVMQYDCVAMIIEKFAEKNVRQGLYYLDLERRKAENLIDIADDLVNAYDSMMSAWKICERYM